MAPTVAVDRSDDALVLRARFDAVMGGAASLVVVASSATGPAEVHHLATRAELRLRTLESRWSRFRDDSELTALNCCAGSPVPVSADTRRLVRTMRSAARMTQGAVDAGALPQVLHAGYTCSALTAQPAAPIPSDARRDLDHWSQVVIDDADGYVRLPPTMAIDPGGVGKGLAADLVAADLVAAGAVGVLVEVGGDLRVLGRAPDPRGWFISVADPFAPDGALALLAVGDAAVATSSTRIRRFGADGHHLVGPDGTPAEGRLAACTAVSTTGAGAEVFAKAPIVMGEDAGLQLAEQHAAAVLCIRSDGSYRASSRWSAFVVEESVA